MTIPEVKLDQGIHVMHLFYRVNRVRWESLGSGESEATRDRLQAVVKANPGPGHPRVITYGNVGGKADFGVILMAADLVQLGKMHRDLEQSFPSGSLELVYQYLSVTELPEYVTTHEDLKRSLVEGEKLEPGTEEFDRRFQEMKERTEKYQHYRLYPELPDWEVMCFYPMSKRRSGEDNWYRLDLETRKELMKGHAKVGRQYAGRVTQLITGSTGLDDWEWGVTLVAHQADAIKEIVYEMRFDEVSSRYGEFGPFFLNLRLDLPALWEHLRL